MQQRQGWKRTDFFKLETTKDGPVVEDNALGTYPNSVHLYMTSLVTVLVQTTFCGFSIKPIEASGFEQDRCETPTVPLTYHIQSLRWFLGLYLKI